MGIKMILFDMDGTLVDYAGAFGSSWDALGIAAGVGKEFKEKLNKYWLQRAQYLEWVRDDVALLKGKEFELIKNKLLPPPYSIGVKELFQHIKGNYILGLITGGVGFVAEHIVKELGMDFHIANDLHVVDGIFDGNFTIHVEMWKHPDKAHHIKELREKYGLTKENIVFVGDHENDLTAGAEAGIFVVRDPKSELMKQKADHIIYDFRELIPILKK